MALMLHATCYNATVAPFIGGNNTHYGWTTCMHSQRQRAEGEYVCNTAGQLFPNVLLSVSQKNAIIAGEGR